VRRLILRLVLPVALLGCFLIPATPASAATKVISGTIDGADGQAVNALVAFDVLDKNKHKIDLNGAGAYSWYIIVNPTLPVTGAAKSGSTRTTWSVNLPANAVWVYIEVYPKAPHPRNPNIQLKTDQTRYGQALRRALPAASRNVQLRLPVVCGQPGGTTGGIKGRVTKRGKLVQAERVRAWSTAPDSAANRTILGWNMGKAYAGSLYQGYYNFVVPNLASGQGYYLWVTEGSVTKKVKVARVNRCQGTVVNVAI
jgi:hypothetical protein